MGKMNELSMLTEELRKCGETLISISEELASMFSTPTEEKQPVKENAAKKAEEPKPKVQEEKPLTLEDVRAVCADKSRKGFTADVKAILTKHGADKLSDVNPAEYKALLAEVEVLSRADGKTQICPDCGTREALDSIGVDVAEQEQILDAIHRSMRG